MVWGNPRTTSNLNCLFWMHNWKWMNLSLSKMASLNINRRQISFDKKHNLSLRFRSVFPFHCCFAGSLQFFSLTVKQTNFSTPISEMFFTFFLENRVFLKVLSSWSFLKSRWLWVWRSHMISFLGGSAGLLPQKMFENWTLENASWHFAPWNFDIRGMN